MFLQTNYKSRIFVELVETKQNMNQVLLIFDVQVGISSFPQPLWFVTGSPSQNHKMFKRTFWEFLECMFTCNEWTNKQTNMSINVWNQHIKTCCMCPFDRTHSFRDNEEQSYFPPGSGPTRTLRSFFWAGIYFPQILDQLVHTVETKKNDTMVLLSLDSSQEKCSFLHPCDYSYQHYSKVLLS